MDESSGLGLGAGLEVTQDTHRGMTRVRAEGKKGRKENRDSDKRIKTESGR